MSAIINDVKANEQIYERLREELEENHWGEWAIIVKGKLLAVAPTMEKALKQAGEMPSDVLSRLVRRIGEELPKPDYGKALLLVGNRLLKECNAVIDYRQEQTTLAN